ncbi:UDP-N-acetylmuramoyl-tripeptide--D-alanyl-D-alanine ligase [Luteimonas sp. RC10]|uniref:UDP-N-acetylmuramoyl-tripeptide--D-alanyl-D- alanine ligase n=1 Tax=Luteimonas sp. RC10 TaxID=2587035 RepID=UPI0016098A22|nr:UDP-N-acetylmuramoyl-tripeptide--D-alanyl-D-alanine ligase [Luteimonas sp. RC10]MBB3345460.1 UDP-N-acetylmuramoyl-tripeptide--D-alanyl-D-alanine ligase [Luteimonas sp. RC10]
MTPLSLARIAALVNGRLQGADDDVQIEAVVTDTRRLDAADARARLFVALRGENFDGHAHVARAAELGVRAALVARPLDLALPQIVVADPQVALGALATAVQRVRVAQVVAITGSNGKTSVKQLTVEILRRHAATCFNPGNLNNEIGLPLSILDAPEDAVFAVYEMGAGQPGDIAYLTAIARPRIALVNNVAPAHLERMGSLLGIADTKAAVYDALPADGTAVINADDAFAPYFAERAHGRRLLRFGIEATADVVARAIRPGEAGTRFQLITPAGEAPVALPLVGRHNVRNALAAAAIALAAGVPLATIVEGLEAAQAVSGRLARHRLSSGAALIDDSYNANPGSLHAAIDTLASTPGTRWLVLGDMRELGADGAAMHAQAGLRAKAAGIAALYALGPLAAHAADAFGDGAQRFDTHAVLAQALVRDLGAASATHDTRSSTDDRPAITILVKGSRGSAMDRTVAALLDAQGTHDAA